MCCVITGDFAFNAFKVMRKCNAYTCDAMDEKTWSIYWCAPLSRSPAVEGKHPAAGRLISFLGLVSPHPAPSSSFNKLAQFNVIWRLTY
jgi:hypothetical protein